MIFVNRIYCLASCAALLMAGMANSQETAFPVVGQAAPEFALQGVAGSLQGEVSLKETLKQGPVVLVVLRGFPEKQCPLCSKQVASFVREAKAFKKAQASVLMVYPGGAKDLEIRASEFLKDSQLPEPFSLLIDPGYTFTNAYHLRWDAPKETAYPSTFVIDTDGIVRMATVSKSHGGRADVADVLTVVQSLSK